MTVAIFLVFVLFFILAGMGMPVAFVLGICGALGLWFTIGVDTTMGVMGTVPFRQAASLILTTIPMFLLMAEIANAGKITERLFTSAEKLIGHIRGGLGLATIAAATIMGSISGSSVASTAAFATTAAPAMEKRGYSRRLAMGLVASTGTIAIMIPPSLPLILYGIMTETSVSKLFLAGIIPGLLTAVGYFLTLMILIKNDHKQIEREQLAATEDIALNTSLEQEDMSARGKWLSLRSVLPVLLVGIIVMGGIYTGFMTVTQSAGIGAFAMLIVAYFSRGLNFAGLNIALTNTARTTTMIMSVVICAYFFAYFMTTTRITNSLVEWIESLPLPAHAVLIIIVLIYIILGCFLDQTAVLIILLPLTFPIITNLGFDAIWFGIIITKTVIIPDKYWFPISN